MNERCDALDVLACPVDGNSLRQEGHHLLCPSGHSYPVVEGIPVMLRSDVEHTIGIARDSLNCAQRWLEGWREDPHFIETLGISPAEREGVRALASSSTRVDPVISHLVGATNGLLYRNLVGHLDVVPIPNLRMPHAGNQRLLDVGCSWGRWSMAAAQEGYHPIGIDPSLGAVLAAKRLAACLGLPFEGVVGDARYLPFRAASIDAAFSYSVLQHFAKPDAVQALSEIARVTRPGSLVKIQMASALGLRSMQHILRRRMREPEAFDVRYWLPGELVAAFRCSFGNAYLEADCYFGLGLQPSDSALFSQPRRVLIRFSEALRRASTIFRPLAFIADSVYLTSRCSDGAHHVKEAA